MEMICSAPVILLHLCFSVIKNKHIEVTQILEVPCSVEIISPNSPHLCIHNKRQIQTPVDTPSRAGPWASYQIRKIAICSCAGNAGNFPPRLNSKETTCKRPRHASRHVRHARVVMHVGIAYPGRRGKRSRHSRRMRIRNFSYLARGPCRFVYSAFIIAVRYAALCHFIYRVALYYIK